jgi:hypothetical protein
VITLQEWQVAVDNHPLVRLVSQTMTNSEMAGQIGTGTTPSDAEIWIEDLASWVLALQAAARLFLFWGSFV